METENAKRVFTFPLQKIWIDLMFDSKMLFIMGYARFRLKQHIFFYANFEVPNSSLRGF